MGRVIFYQLSEAPSASTTANIRAKCGYSACSTAVRRSLGAWALFRAAQPPRPVRPGLPRPRAAKKNENMQHSAFPRGPPPQYYPSSNQLIFPVRMGRVDPG